MRADLSREAVRLTRALVDLLPEELEAQGLLALELLTEARRPARFSADGQIVLLADQDRSTWDGELAREGRGIIAECMVLRRPGPYQLQAAIAAVHSMAPSFDRTAWPQILSLYDELWSQQPTAVVELNRAVAVSMAEGPSAALPLVDAIRAGGMLGNYHLLYGVRGDLLRKLGRHTEANLDFLKAAELTRNEREKAFLLGRAAEEV